jgi:predicted nucleic acid-binding Zn ribbon protein
MSSADIKQKGGRTMLEIAVFLVVYLLIVNVVLPRFGIRFG